VVVEKTANLVDQLRAGIRPLAADLAAIDLNDALRNLLDFVGPLLRRYRTRLDTVWGDLPPVTCIVDQLDQAVLNILVNAVQAAGPGGAVRLCTAREGETARITVQDSGPGIAPDVLDRIFEPFFTTKPRGEGTGLGLAIARRIVLRHGGTITAASRPGEGATFTINIPLRQIG
ncbi:MAG: HAMP domain-containing histidine kinase, partial [Thermoleophilia bacterium]|nr:HAMP domain-containing histidine kinase [Thermoleophilia bacterium]